MMAGDLLSLFPSGSTLDDTMLTLGGCRADALGGGPTGAYCFTMANNYNGTRRIPVVFARDGQARLVVRRETWEDLMARNVTA